ncbi:MAG: hypothetical protein ABFS16_12210 [Bacteroidota bacterium]
MKKLLLPLLLLLTVNAFSQYSQLQKGDTAKVEYPYKFPIMGNIAYEKGFDLPYPAGSMFNLFWARQDIDISELQIGFSEGIIPDVAMTDISEIVEFETISASALSVNVRPDLWVFPFLNVYGIFGKTWSQTEVVLNKPFKFSTVAELNGQTYGFGFTGAGGLGKYFFVMDGNWTWTDMTNFKEPVRSKVFSTRIGRAFKVSKHPESNLAWWVGAMRIKMGGVTAGTIAVNEILPSEIGANRDQFLEDYYAWYDALPPKDKLDPKVIVSKQIVDNIISPADGSGQIHYSLRKEPKQKWNMLIGGQYQINKHHQLRAEAGFLGSRTSFLFSYNYRFGF